MRLPECGMKRALCLTVALLAGPVAAQERKPVPTDSVRVFVAGCAKGYVFTASGRADDRPAGSVVPEGTHLRLSGPKKLIGEIKAREGDRLEIIGLIRKGQVARDGVGIGIGGGRMSGGPPVASGSIRLGFGAGRIVIDVEGWRRIAGECTVR